MKDSRRRRNQREDLIPHPFTLHQPKVQLWWMREMARKPHTTAILLSQVLKNAYYFGPCAQHFTRMEGQEIVKISFRFRLLERWLTFKTQGFIKFEISFSLLEQKHRGFYKQRPSEVIPKQSIMRVYSIMGFKFDPGLVLTSIGATMFRFTCINNYLTSSLACNLKVIYMYFEHSAIILKLLQVFAVLCMSTSICFGCPQQTFLEGHLSIRVGLGCGV